MGPPDQAESWVGRSALRRVKITPEMIDRFADLSGDRSPIHMQASFAQRQGFSDRVAHGMLLGSLVSALLGMELPGEGGVIQEMRLGFRKPCHANDEVTVEVAVTEFFESVQTLVLKVKITRANGDTLVTGQVQSVLMVSDV